MVEGETSALSQARLPVLPRRRLKWDIALAGNDESQTKSAVSVKMIPPTRARAANQPHVESCHN
jgi:hypothetical protein